MSYISAALSQDRKTVTVWERQGEHRVTKEYPAPYYFYVTDPDGKYTTMYGTKASKLVCKNAWEFKSAKEQCERDKIEMWESDIDPVLRVLASEYFNAPIPKLNITFWDIEVDYRTKVYKPDHVVTAVRNNTLHDITCEEFRETYAKYDKVYDEEIDNLIDPEYSCYLYEGPTGFSSVSNPYAPINSVSLHHYWKKETVLICVPPEPGWDENHLIKEMEIQSDGKVTSGKSLRVFVVEDETELVKRWIKEIQESDCLVGWNSSTFDAPMMAKRLIHIYGEKGIRHLNFPNSPLPYFREVEIFKRVQQIVECEGRLFGDYLQLFRKYEPGERPSYKLSAIEQEVGLNLPKLEYKGSLANLYRTNFAFFCLYNIRDTDILSGFEDRKGYVGVANMMYHMSCALWDHVTGTLRLAELATILYCHYERNVIVPNTPRGIDLGSIEGAYVLYPQVGLHENVFNVDVTSLYPSAIRSLNISPEMERGQFLKNKEDVEIFIKGGNRIIVANMNGKHVKKSADEWREFLTENKWAVSGFGTIYDQTKMGIIPAILTDWFEKRLYHKKMVKDCNKAADAIMAKYTQKGL